MLDGVTRPVAQPDECTNMLALALQTAAEGGGQVEEIARTFGVDWPHLLAQIVSFGIVCAVLYLLAYKPILKILARPAAADRRRPRQRREDQGRTGAHRGRAARHPGEGRRRRQAADRGGPRRGGAGPGRGNAEGRRRRRAGRSSARAKRPSAIARSMLAELRREVGRLVVQTTAAVTGKVLTPDDHRRLAEETARQLR